MTWTHFSDLGPALCSLYRCLLLPTFDMIQHAADEVSSGQVVPTSGGGLSSGPGGWQHQAQMQEAVTASAVGQGFIRQLDEHTERQAEVDEARRFVLPVWPLASPRRRPPRWCRLACFGFMVPEPWSVQH